MQFLIIGHDGTDTEATLRREAMRADHIALGDQLLASGNMWYGAALLNDEKYERLNVYDGFSFRSRT